MRQHTLDAGINTIINKIKVSKVLRMVYISPNGRKLYAVPSSGGVATKITNTFPECIIGVYSPDAPPTFIEDDLRHSIRIIR